MKLFHKYNRINLSFMLMIFLLSGILYFVLVRFVLIHELDEALTDYKDRIESYINQYQQLPQKNKIDETLVDFYPVSQPQKSHNYFIHRYDENEGRSHKYRQLEFTEQIGKQYYRVTIAKELEGTNTLMRLMFFATALLILLIIMISALINMILLKRLWKPFYSTISQLRNFKLGSKEVLLFDETQIEEFSFLNQNLNATMERAKVEYKTLKEFTENAAHELQTPVSIIRSKLDLIIQQEGLSEKQTDAIKSAYQAIQRLNKLNQSLLLLAKIENQQFEERQTIDFKKKVSEKTMQFKDIWDGMKLNVSMDLNTINIMANDTLIDVLLNNVFSNAVQHNHIGGSVDILLTSDRLTISNSGQPNALSSDKMFERFSKLNQSSKQNGLGLSIVKEICEQSEIEIFYSFNNELHCFEFYLGKVVC